MLNSIISSHSRSCSSVVPGGRGFIDFVESVGLVLGSAVGTAGVVMATVTVGAAMLAGDVVVVASAMEVLDS